MNPLKNLKDELEGARERAVLALPAKTRAFLFSIGWEGISIPMGRVLQDRRISFIFRQADKLRLFSGSGKRYKFFLKNLDKAIGANGQPSMEVFENIKKEVREAYKTNWLHADSKDVPHYQEIINAFGFFERDFGLGEGNLHLDWLKELRRDVKAMRKKEFREGLEAYQVDPKDLPSKEDIVRVQKDGFKAIYSNESLSKGDSL